MAAFDWRPVQRSDPERLAEARMQLLSAAQWLARVQRSYAEPARDDDLDLRWSDDRHVIATRRFASELGVELQIGDLAMQFTEQGEPSSHEIDVEERSPAHVEAWILIELLHRGVDRDRFSKDLPYDVSALMSGDGVEFAPGEYGGELRRLDDWFRNAVAAIRGALAGEAGELRISPQTLNVEAVSGGRTLGFSPGDADTAEPFFYVSQTSGHGDAERKILTAAAIPDHGAAEAVLAFFAEGAAATRH